MSTYIVERNTKDVNEFEIIACNHKITPEKVPIYNLGNNYTYNVTINQSIKIVLTFVDYTTLMAFQQLYATPTVPTSWSRPPTYHKDFDIYGTINIKINEAVLIETDHELITATLEAKSFTQLEEKLNANY